MIKIEGIHLVGDNQEELHEVANKFLISKSWFSSQPYLHYEIVYPLKLDDIARYIRKQNGK